MDNKCDKFEAMFVFASEEDFQKHLSECADCREEYSKADKLSSLIKEAAPLYLAKERNTKFKKIMSCCVFLFFAVASIIGLGVNTYRQGDVGYSETSVIYDLGLPVDDYGLLKI